MYPERLLILFLRHISPLGIYKRVTKRIVQIGHFLMMWQTTAVIIIHGVISLYFFAQGELAWEVTRALVP